MIEHRLKNREQEPRGIALLLSLLLMAALTAAGIGASSVIISEFRTTSSTDSGIEAYYAADVGVERSLYNIFNDRLGNVFLGDETQPNNFPYVVPQVRYNLPTMAPLRNTGVIDLLDTTISQATKVVNVAKEQSVQLELFDPNNQLSSSAPIARRLILRSPSLSTLSPNAWVEVQWSYIKKSAASANFQPNSTIRLVATQNLSGDVGHGVILDLLTGGLSPVNSGDPAEVIVNPQGITASETTPNEGEIAGWNVRIKALYGDVPNLTIQAQTSSSVVYPLPGDFSIISRGSVDNSHARLDATVPWKLPSSGLFDYVVFSESNLDKPGN